MESFQYPANGICMYMMVISIHTVQSASVRVHEDNFTSLTV